MKEKILEDLAKAKNYTIQVAAAMPEDDFDFKPVAHVWSFREMIHHIAYSLAWMEDSYISKTEKPWNPPAIPDTKDELITYLTGSFNRIDASIKKAPASDDLTASFYGVLDHNAHHRGQAVTYLRCRNISAPAYPF